MGEQDVACARERSRVLAASRELFATQGYESTTLAQVADLAGVDEATVRSVGSKDDLLQQLITGTAAVAVMGLLARPCGTEQSFAEQIVASFDPWYDQLHDARPLLREAMLATMHPGTVPDEQPQVLEALSRRLLTHSPRLEPERARCLAFAIHSTLVAGLMSVLGGRDDEAHARLRNLRVVRELTDAI